MENLSLHIYTEDGLAAHCSSKLLAFSQKYVSTGFCGLHYVRFHVHRIVIAPLLLACGIAIAAGLQPGQTWSYKTRPGESGSTLTVLKVERYDDLGSVVHIRVDGIKMTNPVKGNAITDIPHLPFKEAAVQASITKQISRSSAIPPFQDGYDTWKKAYIAGQAGAFATTVSATLDAMLGANWEERK